MEQHQVSRRQVEIEKCRSLFPLFARAMVPGLSLDGYHMKYYRILHRFATGKIKKLIVTMPPQHGKSLGSTTLLPAFILGQNPDKKIAIASYSTTFAQKFNRHIQRTMDNMKYIELFPGTLLPPRMSGMIRTHEEFEIVNANGSLKAVGRGGPLTGNPVDVMILDDLYKDAMEGNSPVIREQVIDWYASVVKTRLHNDSQELIVFTRWHEDDLIGKIEKEYDVITLTSLDQIKDDFKGWYKINFEAIQTQQKTELDSRDVNEPLWPKRHSYELLIEKRAFDPISFQCLYQGNPRNREGLLYDDNFTRYLPFDEVSDKQNPVIKKANYTDTADMGTDELCSICYDVRKDGKFYVTDVYLSPERMEITEIAVAKMLADNNTRIAYVESNNGGRGFARNLGRIDTSRRIEWFHQNGNKESRILTNAAPVLQNIIMPHDWHKRWPDFYNKVVNFKRNFKANVTDDAPDVLTGIIEKELRNYRKPSKHFAI